MRRNRQTSSVIARAKRATSAAVGRAAPLVSVITPFFNAEAFLEQAIDSVVWQTYPHWELLLVDDGSKDASTAMALLAQANDAARIRYLRHSDGVNRGAGPSRNLALAHARGEFVAFLDADDIWFPDKLTNQVGALASRPDVDLLCGRTLFWHFPPLNPAGDERDFVHGMASEPGLVHEPPKLLALLLRHEEIHPANCCILVRRRACDAYANFDERVPRLYEDTVLLAKLFLHTRVMVSSECVAAYRIHACSTCHRAAEAGSYSLTSPNPARERFVRWLEDYLEECGCNDLNVWRALRRQLLPYRYPLLYRVAQKAKPSVIRWLQRRLAAPAGRAPHSRTRRAGTPDCERSEVAAARCKLTMALRDTDAIDGHSQDRGIARVAW